MKFLSSDLKTLEAKKLLRQPWTILDKKYLTVFGIVFEIFENEVQSTLGFATMGKAANLCLATRNAVTDLFKYYITTLYLATSNLASY